MAITMHPYLNYPDDNCREAFSRYAEIFDGDTEFVPLSTMTHKPEDDATLMHAAVRTPEFTLYGADSCGRKDIVRGDAYSVALMAQKADEDRLREAFDKLAEGGTVNMPLELQPWGDVYGDVTDRYGVDWAINIGQEN